VFRYGATLAEMFAYQKYLQSNEFAVKTLSSHIKLPLDFLAQRGTTFVIKPELGIELDFDSYLNQSHQQINLFFNRPDELYQHQVRQIAQSGGLSTDSKISEFTNLVGCVSIATPKGSSHVH